MFLQISDDEEESAKRVKRSRRRGKDDDDDDSVEKGLREFASQERRYASASTTQRPRRFASHDPQQTLAGSDSCQLQREEPSTSGLQSLATNQIELAIENEATNETTPQEIVLTFDEATGQLFFDDQTPAVVQNAAEVVDQVYQPAEQATELVVENMEEFVDQSEIREVIEDEAASQEAQVVPQIPGRSEETPRFERKRKENASIKNEKRDGRPSLAQNFHAMFRNVHACVKQQLPLRHYSWLCQLDQAKSWQPIEAKYLNQKQAKIFLKTMAQRLRAEFSGKLQQASTFSVSVDSETIAEETVFIIRVQIVSNGNVDNALVAVESVPANVVDPTEHWNAIWRGLTSVNGNQLEKMASIYLDGVCVQRSQHQKIFEHAQLTVPSPAFLTGVHRQHHRLYELFWNNLKELELFKKVYLLVRGLHSFYGNNPRQRLLLETTAEKENLELVLPAGEEEESWVHNWVTALMRVQKGHSLFCKHLSEVPSQQGM